MKKTPEQFFVKDDGIFPNNSLPVLYYPKAVDLPKLFPPLAIKNCSNKIIEQTTGSMAFTPITITTAQVMKY